MTLLLPKPGPELTLKQLRWVEEVKKTEHGWAVRTKGGVFSTELTHKIRKGYSSYDPELTVGALLEKPIPLVLPAYWIHLNENGFKFSFVEKPEAPLGRVGSVPQYQYVSSVENWSQPITPCYGEGKGTGPELRSTYIDYMESKEWEEKAVVAAIYLQSAEPHYGENWYRTAYAFRLGLVGDELFEGEKIIQQQTL